jgi:glycerate 2-kinase
MRVLIAPDKFAGTLTAVEAAEAMAEGWRRRDPEADIVIAPMADGGPGFIDVLSSFVDGSLLSVTVEGPLRTPVPATVLLSGTTAYVESAQACGLHLSDQRAEEATTYGVGRLIDAAIANGADRIIIGLGGSGTNDAGAGMLAALGATPEDHLMHGAAGLEHLDGLDLGPARDRLSGVRLTAASDVENPLLGLRGATNVFGSQKGLSDERKPVVDGWLERFADAADRRLADAKGAGAAGGLGYGLLLLGAELVSGIGLVMSMTRLADHARQVDLVLTGEGSFDFQSRGGKVVSGVAKVAGEAMRPCVVLAGRVQIGAREMRTMGVESAYGLVDMVGEERALADPHGSLAAVAERVARTWAVRG